MPFHFSIASIGLGILIPIDSHTLENRGLATIALTISGLTILMLLRKTEQIANVKAEAEET